MSNRHSSRDARLASRGSGTTARKNDGTMARQHEGTTARRNERTTARKNDGTKEREEEKTGKREVCRDMPMSLRLERNGAMGQENGEDEMSSGF